MSREAEVALSSVFARMGRVRHVLFDLAQVRIKNQVAIQLDLNR